MTASFTACSKPLGYAMTMSMLTRLALFAVTGAVSLSPMAVPDSLARGGRDEQDAARQAMLDGRVMPFSVIKRRMEREMGDASYLGSEFHPNTNRYRLKYVRDGKVVWVDVDGRTGEIAGWAR